MTAIAPTGTISFVMDCESTGVEPVIALEAVKELAGGGELDVSVSECVKVGMEVSGEDNLTHPIFATALGDNVVSPEGHVKMMAAVQPFISGAISKTVKSSGRKYSRGCRTNLPNGT